MQTDEFLEAIRKNDNEKIVALLKVARSLADAREPGGVSAIFLALYRGNVQAAQEIASKKSNLDVYEAAALGDLNQIKKLVERDGSLVKSYSPDGFTALALAAYLGQKDTTTFLLEKGADPNAVAKNETGFTALTGAVSQNQNEVAKILVKGGANVNYSYEGGFTPLMHAAHAGNVELVNLLLEKGANPNAKNSEGKSSMTFATENNHVEVVKLLKKHGTA